MKTGGGNAGHNGLRSISAHVGNDYRRVRFGIGHPGDKNLVEPYVLQDFAKDEGPGWKRCAMSSPTTPRCWLEGKDSTFQNKVHLAMDAKGFGFGTTRAGRK